MILLTLFFKLIYLFDLCCIVCSSWLIWKIPNSQVCTFRLVVKNASSLLADKDPVKLAAETKLIDLIRYPVKRILSSRSGLICVYFKLEVVLAVY